MHNDTDTMMWVATALGLGGVSFVVAPVGWYFIPMALGAIGVVLAFSGWSPNETASGFGLAAGLSIAALAVGVWAYTKVDDVTPTVLNPDALDDNPTRTFP